MLLRLPRRRGIAWFASRSRALDLASHVVSPTAHRFKPFDPLMALAVLLTKMGHLSDPV